MTNLTEAWINIYKHKNSYWCGTPNHTKSEALLHLADTENYLTTVNIEQLLKLQEENAQLKELLKECREYVAEWFADRTDVPFRQDKPRECVKKIDQVLGDKTDE